MQLIQVIRGPGHVSIWLWKLLITIDYWYDPLQIAIDYWRSPYQVKGARWVSFDWSPD